MATRPLPKAALPVGKDDAVVLEILAVTRGPGLEALVRPPVARQVRPRLERPRLLVRPVPVRATETPIPATGGLPVVTVVVVEEMETPPEARPAIAEPRHDDEDGRPMGVVPEVRPGLSETTAARTAVAEVGPALLAAVTVAGHAHEAEAVAGKADLPTAVQTVGLVARRQVRVAEGAGVPRPFPHSSRPSTYSWHFASFTGTRWTTCGTTTETTSTAKGWTGPYRTGGWSCSTTTATRSYSRTARGTCNGGR